MKNCERWSEQHSRLVFEIRSAINDDHDHVIGGDKLRLIINTIMKHSSEVFEMKTRAANVEVFNNVGSAIWCTTAERDLLWIGGFRPSELLQVNACFTLSTFG